MATDLRRIVEQVQNPAGAPPAPAPDSDVRDLSSIVAPFTDPAGTAAVTPPGPEGDTDLGDEFARGFGSGVDGLQLALYGIARKLGRDTGLVDLEDFGIEGINQNIEEMQRNPLDVAGFTDIESMADFFSWSAGALGQAIPSLGTAVAGGGIGGILGKKAIERTIRKRFFRDMTDDMMSVGVSREASEQAVNNIMRSQYGWNLFKNSITKGQATMIGRGFTAGAAFGAAGVSVPQQMGEALGQSEDVDLSTAFIAGLAGGALEAYPALRLLRRAFPGVEPRVAGQFVQDFVKATGSQALIEGSTEAAQQIIQLAALAYHDPTFDMLDPHNTKQIIDSFAAGALVGTVTGGGAEVVGTLQRPVERPQIETDNVDPVTDGFPENFQPADNTVFEEVRDRVNTVMTEKLNPAVNTIRDQVQQGINAISRAIPGLNEQLGELARPVREAHAEFVEGHRPVIEDAQRYAREQIAWMTEQAEKITDPAERQKFIDETMQEVRDQFDSVAKTLRDRATQILRRAEGQVDSIGVFDDEFTSPDVERETDFVFGKDRSYKNDRGQTVTYITRGEQADPYKSRSRIENQLEKLRRRYPNIPESAFEIREVEGGFVVAIDSSGQFQQLRMDEGISDAIDKARESARGREAPQRQVDVQIRGVTGRTILDIPTLVNKARFLEGGLQQGTENAFASMIGQMLGDGWIGDTDAQALLNKFYERYPQAWRDQSLGETIAREQTDFEERAGQFTDEDVRTEDQELGITRDEEGNVIRDRREQSEEERFIEEGIGRKLETEKTQARRQSSAEKTRDLKPGESRKDVQREQRQRLKKEQIRDRTKKKKQREAKKRGEAKRAKRKKPKPPTQAEKMTSKGKVEVFMRTPDGKKMADGVLRESIKELGERVAKLLNPNTKIRIINRPAALEMVRKNHEHADKARQLLDRNRFAVLYDSDGPTYILVDDFEDAGTSMAGLIHEMGHVIHYDTWEQLSEQEQDELWNAFVEDVKSGKRGSGARLNQTGQDAPHVRNIAPLTNIFEFREWMADNFVDWMANRRQPRNALERFMEAVAQKMDQFWAFLSANPGRFNRLNETYADFADALARKIAGVPPTDNTRFFRNEGAAGRPRHVLFDGGEQVVPKGVTKREWNEIRKRVEQQYPVIAKRAATIVNWFRSAYNLAVAPSTSVMRDMQRSGIKSAGRLVRMFNREEHGKAKTEVNYHQATFLRMGRYMSKLDNIMEGMSEADKVALNQELRALDGTDGKPQSLKARQVRRLLDEIHEYLIEAGLPVGKIQNYYPRMLNREKVIADEEKLRKLFWDDYGKRHPHAKAEKVAQEFNKWYNGLINYEADAAAALREVQDDELAMQAPGFRAMRSRTTNAKWMQPYYKMSIEDVLSNYITSAVKKAEYNKRLGSKAPEGRVGGDRLPKSVWNSRGKLEQLFDDARKEGATQEQLKLMKDYVDANLGMLGRDSVPEGVRKGMAGVVAYQNMRVLLFTVFASLPDMVGPAIRSGDLRGSFKTMMKNVRDAAQNENDLAEMARTWGIISSVANQHVLTEYVDNHYMPPTLRRWNDSFFKWTGLNWYTDFTRKSALAVGINTIKTEAAKVNDASLTQKQRDRAKQFLAELGLTADMVDVWVSRGEPVWGGTGYDQDSAVDQKIAEGLVQFVDESIMRPNASQRPILASHPAAMLIYHLKGYIYAIYDVVLKRMAHNFRTAGRDPNLPMSENVAQIAAAIAPAIAMLALTAVGMELRELVTGNRRTDKMDGWEYTWETTERSGLLGLLQLGWDFADDTARGQSELAALSGPAIDQLADLISRPASQTIPKGIPVVSQLPWARNALREATPL